MHRTGTVNLRGLRPLLRAELQWGMYVHGLQSVAVWHLTWVQSLADECQRRDVASLVGLDASVFRRAYHQRMVQEVQQALRKIYFAPSDTREAGYIETEHFGMRFPGRSSYVDLTCISQRWLRDLLWDHIADALSSPTCPRSAQPVDFVRRAGAGLSAFLEAEAPCGGHEPSMLRGEHIHCFVADLRNRERLGLAFRGQARLDGKRAKVTENSRRMVFNYGRALLRGALNSGSAERIGLDRGFIAAMPVGGPGTPRSRNPFLDEVARALADEANLRQLADGHDRHDRGLRDMWEIIIVTGRRASEVIQLRLDCVGRYGGLPLLWHDQTKVGNLNAAVRIPDHLLDRLEERRQKTLAHYADRHASRLPTPAERAHLALFPTDILNPDGRRALFYTWFHTGFRSWLAELDLGGHYVAHQARHTLATRLLRHGASLTHIRRYLGHVSDRMAEHYVHLTQPDLDNVLQHVWVAGPGTAHPGELLPSDITPLTREQAQALAIDLSRRSTPAEGGFCTFQPVVNGGACPFNLDCHNCDKFVLSGADLLYWRRKREQWRLLAKTDAAVECVHQTIARLRRGKAQISVAVVARRADVSRTFLYDNVEARAAVAAALTQVGERRTGILVEQDGEREATWRERALNAEDALKAAHAEILAQRNRIGELLGQIRDLEAERTEEAIQRVNTENTSLKQRVRQLAADNRTFDERLKAARSFASRTGASPTSKPGVPTRFVEGETIYPRSNRRRRASCSALRSGAACCGAGMVGA
ncbi:tyrosine-type recombinase/integrase [Streptomyces sp. Act143]|uniref:tyrosine-type recombinase/integrase n=1 Tax=Streptomyces sp. Act143 TaxID=2200760 RepID=UPI00215A7FF2|nr:tyrosine-type recombinase/integrase [Streptomyces sp. Act143]